MNTTELAEQAGLQVWMAYCDKKREVEGLKDEIERLTAERDALRAANKDLQDWYDAAIADAKRYHHVKSKQGLIDSAVDKAMKGQP